MKEERTVVRIQKVNVPGTMWTFIKIFHLLYIIQYINNVLKAYHMTKYHQSHVGSKVTIYHNVHYYANVERHFCKIMRCTMTDTITIETLLVIENKTKIM
jgi:hypothetical protein